MTKIYLLTLVLVKIAVFNSFRGSPVSAGLTLWLLTIVIYSKSRLFLGLIAAASPFLHHLSSSAPEFLVPPLLLGLSLNTSSKKGFFCWLALAVTSLVYLIQPQIQEWNLLTHLQPNNINHLSQLSQNQDYLASGRTFIYPPILRHTLFSWPIQALDQLFKQIYSILDITLWTAPNSGYALLKNWGIPPDQLKPLLFFFDPALILLGLLKTPRLTPTAILFTASLIPAILVQPQWLTLSGVLLASTFWLTQSQINNRLVTLLIFSAGVHHLLSSP